MHLSCQKQAEKYLKGTILAILFKKPTYLKNPWAFSFKKPILPAGFFNGFFTSYNPEIMWWKIHVFYEFIIKKQVDLKNPFKKPVGKMGFLNKKAHRFF